jgi:hypothetical protein
LKEFLFLNAIFFTKTKKTLHTAVKVIQNTQHYNEHRIYLGDFPALKKIKKITLNLKNSQKNPLWRLENYPEESLGTKRKKKTKPFCPYWNKFSNPPPPPPC